MATELEDETGEDSEGSDGYDEAIEALSEIVNQLQLAAAQHKGGLTLRTFNLINSLIELIDEPTMEEPNSNVPIPPASA